MCALQSKPNLVPDPSMLSYMAPGPSCQVSTFNVVVALRLHVIVHDYVLVDQYKDSIGVREPPA